MARLAELMTIAEEETSVVELAEEETMAVERTIVKPATQSAERKTVAEPNGLEIHSEA